MPSAWSAARGSVTSTLYPPRPGGMLPFVDLTARATFTGVTPKRLYEEVANLGNYPDWLSIVHRVEPAPGDDEAWLVDIGARVGFVTRTKRLRMVRTKAVAPEMV